MEKMVGFLKYTKYFENMNSFEREETLELLRLVAAGKATHWIEPGSDFLTMERLMESIYE